MTLFKYRPLSEFLFKELYYQELYFACYSELNDPLDLTVNIDFIPKEENQVEYLIYALYKSTFFFDVKNEKEKENMRHLMSFISSKESKREVMLNIYYQLTKLSQTITLVTIDTLERIVLDATKDLEVTFNFTAFKSDIERLTKKIFENSSTTCFSETNNNFLMWSHYASKHSGICLEFTTEKYGLFPFKIDIKGEQRKYFKDKEIDDDEIILPERMSKVLYTNDRPQINFFDFAPVFENEHDCDLLGLSKSWTHRFAYELEKVFSNKTTPWQYEKEWRAIHINFGDSLEPEERIKNYPIKSLSSIYFGTRTPENVKNRIFKIFKIKHPNLKYFNCKLTSGKELEFEEWEYNE